MSPRSRSCEHYNALLVRSLIVVLAVTAALFAPILTTSTAFAQLAKPAKTTTLKQQSLGLSLFTVKATRDKQALARWETGTELTIIGFNVWRRTPRGQYVKLNADLIAAKNMGEIAGNRYSLRDTKVRPGKLYYYQLEVVSSMGFSAWTEEVPVRIGK